MSNIQLSRLGMYETYNATAEIEGGTRYTRAFVSHNGLENSTRLSIQAAQFGAVVHMSNEEALALAKMLTDAVESRTKDEE